MDNLSNMSKDKSVSSKLSTLTNSNFNKLLKKRKRNNEKCKNNCKKSIKLLNLAKNVIIFPNNDNNNNEKLIFKNEERTKINNKRKTDIIYDKTSRKKLEIHNTFDEIFKYKQLYMDEEKFLNKNDFMKNKNEYNLFSNDNIFNVSQISKNQIDINKKTKENKVK